MTNIPPPPFGDPGLPPPPTQPPPGAGGPAPELNLPPPHGALHVPGQADRAMTGSSGLGLHLRRAFDWNLRHSVITPSERTQLNAVAVTTDHLQRYMAWRRSALFVAVPVIAIAALLNIIEVARNGTDVYNSLGVLLLWLPVLSIVLVPLGGFLALQKWLDLATSAKVLQFCFALSILIPVFVALIPVDLWLDKDFIRNQVGATDLEATLVSVRFLQAISFALVLLPIVVTVPSGVMRGALRAKALVPTSQLPGWFLVGIAPIFGLVLVISFTLVEQIVGNLVLIVGVLLLVAVPLLMVKDRQRFIKPFITDGDHQELNRVVRRGGYLTLAGAATILVWALTAKVGGVKVVAVKSDDGYFTWVQLGRTATEIMARGLVAAVVFAHAVTMMTLRYWQYQRVVPAAAQQQFEQEMVEFEQRLGMAP